MGLLGGSALGGDSQISGQANVAGGHGMARSAERVGRAMGGWSELLTSRGCDAEWRRAGLLDEAPLLKEIASKWKGERDWWHGVGRVDGE